MNFLLKIFLVTRDLEKVKLNFDQIFEGNVIDCGDPSLNLTNLHQHYISGSVPTSTLILITTWVICDSGYFWKDGSLQKNLSCMANGIWNNLVPCIGT